MRNCLARREAQRKAAQVVGGNVVEVPIDSVVTVTARESKAQRWLDTFLMFRTRPDQYSGVSTSR